MSLSYDHTIFVNNKYFRWYCNLINKRLSSSIDEVGEWHHFIPKSIHPNNNLVFLSLREHYVANLLLIRCVIPQFKSKMLYALTAMKMRVVNNICFNSHLFETLKKEANMNRSAQRKGVPRSETTRQKIREARLGTKSSAKTKHKQSIARKGRKNTPEHIEKVRQAHLGKKRSEETKQKLRDERALRQPKECPHCHRLILPGNYNRWHGDNCKLNPLFSRDAKEQDDL